MKLLLLFGPSAVGKMTVGEELMKQTQLRLFYNHMTIEPVIEVFGEFRGDVTAKLRDIILSEFAKSDAYGLIFTYVWAFDQQSDWDYVNSVRTLFENEGAEIYYCELLASQETRLERNKSPHRLEKKASKRDIAFSESLLLRDDKEYRVVSLPGELPFENYLRVDTEGKTAEDVAKEIVNAFHFE